MASTQHVPVLIVGGGLVGLSASLCLSHHNVDSLVIERHSGTSIHPRARSVNARTMEVFRHLEIDHLVRKAGASMRPTGGIFRGSSLEEVIGPKARTKGERKLPFTGLLETTSPVSGQFVTQDMVEPILVDAARAKGGKVLFNTECIGVEQKDDQVIATLKDRQNGAVSIVQANYLVAADGARSPIRAQLNIPTTGQGTMGHLLNILFHASLGEFVRQREFSLCIVERPEVCGVFTSINNDERWVFHLSYDPSKGEKPEDFPAQRCKELLRAALGMPSIEIDIVSIMPWEPSVRIAERFQEGRIFLAGDAAHQMPPWGGQGANSGIADAYNLSWKLAAVLKGLAGETLLETYGPERLPAGREAAEASAAGADGKGFISTKMTLANVKGFYQKLSLVSGHGYGYASKAICQEDTSPLGGATWRPWTLPSLFLAIDGRPGRRVPHVWVEQKGTRISTLDICSKNLVLLAGADGKAWLDAAKHVSSALGVNISAHCVGPEGDLVAPKGTFEAAAGISFRGAMLIRPDDFVGWRERRQSSNQRLLEQAVRAVLCL